MGLVVTLVVGIASMHVLAPPAMAHGPGDGVHSSMPLETSSSRHLDAGHGTGDVAPGASMAGGMCAFAVAPVSEVYRRRTSAVTRIRPLSPESLSGIFAGPEPPVPRLPV